MPNELTNPNNVVTEERLAQFYQQILPYLGGMPDVMMNRFPKGNMYDVDHEVIVGRWIDGKPIYQKTVAYTNKKLFDDYTTLNLNTDPIETVVNGIIVFRVANGGEYDGAMLQVNVYPSSGGTTVQVYKTGTWNAASNRTFYFTAWYTKIGDSAVEIGSDTDYSTTEKIVGTWIDGKPIWQKTVEYTFTSGSGWRVFDNNSIYDKLLGVTGFYTSPTSEIIPFTNTITTVPRFSIQADHKLYYFCDQSRAGYVTLQYTKTS